MLHYAKPSVHPFARWFRYKKEFLVEELLAWKQMAIAVLVGVLFVAAILIFLLPRTSIRLIQLFGGH